MVGRGGILPPHLPPSRLLPFSENSPISKSPHLHTWPTVVVVAAAAAAAAAATTATTSLF